MNPGLQEKFVAIRRHFHRFPELSNMEVETSKKLLDLILTLNPDKTIRNIGGNGLAFVFDSGKPGKTILFRCDTDALPINETSSFEWKSQNPGVSHKCGHDGHMAILICAAELISQSRPEKGKIVLLFQPAEETGEGAARVIADPKFGAIKPDYCFGLHNLPGYKENAVVIRNQTFASASKGLIIKLHGKSSHAAEPELGNSPIKAFYKLLPLLENLAKSKKLYKDFVLATVIHAKLGERAFGTNPGEAVIMLTLRAHRDEDLKIMENLAEGFVKMKSEQFGLEYSLSSTEEFPATINHPEAVETVISAAKKNNLKIIRIAKPFKWSEDFGHFSSICPSAFFGIGAGKNYPGLHHPDYDFPDSLIEHGCNMFIEIYKKTLF